MNKKSGVKRLAPEVKYVEAIIFLSTQPKFRDCRIGRSASGRGGGRARGRRASRGGGGSAGGSGSIGSGKVVRGKDRGGVSRRY